MKSKAGTMRVVFDAVPDQVAAGFSCDVYFAESRGPVPSGWTWCLVGPDDVGLEYGFGFDTAAAAESDASSQVFDVASMYGRWRDRVALEKLPEACSDTSRPPGQDTSTGSRRDVLSRLPADRDLWAPLANLYWWKRNARGDDPELAFDIAHEKARLRSIGVASSAVWQVSRCLKVGRVRFGCNCPMCRHLYCKTVC